MELPIQLKFFRKIELYQEYKFEEYKVKISRTHLKVWKIEKIILAWTTFNHHHLGSVLSTKRIKEEILNNEHNEECAHAINNLIEKGYAISVEVGIKTTKEGLLMGELINDVEGKRNVFHRLKYVSLFALVWSTALTGAIIVIVNFIKLFHTGSTWFLTKLLEMC